MAKSVLIIGGSDEQFDAAKLKARLAPKFPAVELRTVREPHEAASRPSGAVASKARNCRRFIPIRRPTDRIRSHPR